MIKLRDILFEAYLNLHSDKEKLKYVDIVTKLTHSSYAKVGGFKGITDIEELQKEIVEQAKKPNTFWKLSKRDGRVVAVIIYKKTSYGRKSVLVATDGTPLGKENLVKIKIDDILTKRSYAEVSEAVEHIMLKYGAVRIPNDIAEKVLKNHTIIKDDDGYHYRRKINGKYVRKVLVGAIKEI